MMILTRDNRIILRSFGLSRSSRIYWLSHQVLSKRAGLLRPHKSVMKLSSGNYANNNKMSIVSTIILPKGRAKLSRWGFAQRDGGGGRSSWARKKAPKPPKTQTKRRERAITISSHCMDTQTRWLPAVLPHSQQQRRKKGTTRCLQTTK